VAYSQLGSTIASTDADGAVKLWDVRMVAEILTVECSKYPANKAAFDASGAVSTGWRINKLPTADRLAGLAGDTWGTFE
jgi:WD40 repeat protein